MTHKRNPFTEDQLNDARKRHAKGESMASIARMLKVKPDWLRCLIDPVFYERRRISRRSTERRRRQKVAQTGVSPETDIQTLANRRTVKDDLAFIAAMTRSIRAGAESAPMVTRKTPETDNPRFVPLRSLGQLSLTGSSASQCADFA